MDDISIDSIKEIGEYDDAFAKILEARGFERIHEEIIAYVRDAKEKDPEGMREWRRMLLDIARLKEKITEQNEEIHKRVSAYGVSNEEYDEIMADTDLQRQQTHLKRFFEERMSEIHGTLLAQKSLDKQVRSLNEPDEMIEMRRNLYIDRKNITEALSVTLFDDIHIKRIVWSLLDESIPVSDSPSHSQSDSPIEVVFEESMKKMIRILSLVEEHQQRGLQGIRHLEDFDRQIIYMLTALALKKHK